jgi:spore coat protein U-like protein
MKKTIKTLITLMLAVALGSLAHAQSASISVDATVISEIAVANVNNLNFGTLVAGQIKTIDLRGNVSVSTGSTLGTTSQGEFTVAASAGSDVQLSFTLPANLIGPDVGVLPIAFVYDEDVAGDLLPRSALRIVDGLDGQFLSGDPTSPISFRDNSFPTFEAIPGTNSVRVFIGGQVDATNATAGTYIGTITLSATFN